MSKLIHLIRQLHRRLTQRQLLILVSVYIGLAAGLAAVALKTFVHFIRSLLVHDDGSKTPYIWITLFPMVGILLSIWFVQKFLKGELNKGTAYILYVIAKKSSFVPRINIFSHIVTSGLTIGFGGSAGLEGPIVGTGSAIGSNIARSFRFSYRDRTLLLACGAAAGVGAAFNAPVAGVMFAIEVLLVDFTIPAFAPLIIAAATGSLASRIVLDERILLSFSLRQNFNYHNVPYYILLGLLTGGVSFYYAQAMQWVEEIFHQRLKWLGNYGKGIAGGFMLALLIGLFPTLLGEGYESIRTVAEEHPEALLQHSLLNPWSENESLVLLFVGIVALVKVFATSVTLQSGGNGGNFAPSLFTGAYTGFFFARLMNMSHLTNLPEANFMLVGMAGVLSGVFYTPLTAIFLIAEITGGYQLMTPLMIVSALSYALVRRADPHPPDLRALIRLGRVLSHDKDKNVLNFLETSQLIETGFDALPPEASLRDLANVIAHSHRNLFPVISKEGDFLGVITLDDVREMMFRVEWYDQIKVRELMRPPPVLVEISEEMDMVMQKFDATGAWNLPVVEEGKYIGFISKSGVFNKYRAHLKKNSE